MSAPVQSHRDGDVAVITIDDGKANAVSVEVLDGLHAALDAAEDARAVVIAGRAGRFCAGFDLNQIRSERAVELMGGGGRLSLRLLEFPAPVVFAVTGHALAMGAVLLMSADYRVGAAGEFKLGLNEVRIGLALPPFASTLARHRLSPNHLTPATQLATVYTPEQAREVGFLDEVVPPGEVVDRAVALAQGWAADLDRAAFLATRPNLRGPLLEELVGRVAGS